MKLRAGSLNKTDKTLGRLTKKNVYETGLR